MRPNFVIIGAQKSASTFVHRCLSEHPGIYLPAQEIPFFESPLFETSSMEQLEALFVGREGLKLGIKRPSYLAKPEVPQRLSEHLDNAKLIAVLRNPVARAVSAYYHYINYGFMPAIDIEIGMRRLLQQPCYSEHYRRSSEILEFGYYAKHLARYRDFLERDRLLVLLHEDIVAKPLDSIRAVYQFVGVDSDFIPKQSIDTRPQAVIYNLYRLRVLTLRNRFIYQYNDTRTGLVAKQPGVLGQFLVSMIKLFDQKLLLKWLGNQKPMLSQELKALLQQAYLPDIEQLETMIARDLSAWKSS